MIRLSYLLLYFLLTINPLQALEILSARLGNHKTYTRVVFRFSHPLSQFKVMQKQGKEIIIALDEPTLSLKAPPLEPPIQIGRITSYHLKAKDNKKYITLHLSTPGTLRRIFDLAPLNQESYRLVIDIQHERASPSKDPVIIPKAPPLEKPLDKKVAIEPGDAIGALASQLMTSDDIKNPISDLDSKEAKCPSLSREGLKIPSSLKDLPLPEMAVLSDKPVIVIDPGHGGKDFGTATRDKRYEKNITLQYALSLQKALNQSGHYTAVLTRTQDVFVPLRERFARAQQVGAHLLISLHVDHSSNRKLKGLSVYVLSDKAMDAEGVLLTQRENAMAATPGLEMYKDCPLSSQKIVKLSQKKVLRQSLLLQNYLAQSIPAEHHHISHIKRSADLAILKAPNIPSVLIELGYASHQQDQKKLRDKDYENTIIASMVKAIHMFFDKDNF